MREMSVAEQRYQAVLAVIAQGETVKDVAARCNVSRQNLHGWLARYEAGGLENLADRSHRPASCPHQMPAVVEAAVLEMRRAHPFWGPRRIVFELGRAKVTAVVSESAVYRCLVRAGVIEGRARRGGARRWRRWERGPPMELWQLDTVGGFGCGTGRVRRR
jgi:transposase